MSVRMHVVDGDGHIFENDPEMAKFLPPVYGDRDYTGDPYVGTANRMFPPLDRIHAHVGRKDAEAFGAGKRVGVDEWRAFMDFTGIERSVLFPTRGLAVGNIIDPDWAVNVTRSYNSWLHQAYLQVDERFQGVGLLPMQDPEAAVEELRRAVQTLGMRGGLMPTNGLKGHLGSREYWPVFAEAERLGCCIAIHGGAHGNLGLDTMTPYAAAHALGHPFGLMIQFAGIVMNGIFDRFPRVRVGFLEGGVAWFLLMLERLDRSYSTHIPYDPEGRYIRLQDGETIHAYVLRKIREGQIFIGCEGEEPELPYAMKVTGNGGFVFSSDFPHEVTPATSKHEIEEVLESTELSEEAKEAVLFRNAERLYGLQTTAGVAEALAVSS